MKKLDTAGALVYAGLAGLIGALVLNMVVVILGSLIFGASPVVVAGGEAVAPSMGGMTMPTATPDTMGGMAGMPTSASPVMGGMTAGTATPASNMTDGMNMGGMTMPTATPEANMMGGMAGMGGTPTPTPTPGTHMMGGVPMEGTTMPTATPEPPVMGGTPTPTPTPDPNMMGGMAGGPQAGPTPTPMPMPMVEGFAIYIENLAFQPDKMEIMAAATKVTWVNRDSVTHTVTGKGFDSGPLAPGATFSMIFDTTGVYDFWCTIHPTMKGVVDYMEH